MRFSACIEWLFADEAPVFADRIRLAHAAGLNAVEFWTWTDKDLPAIEAALAETGVAVAAIVAEPMIALTNPANKTAFLDGLRRSVETARRLGAGVLIAQAGDDQPGRSRAMQRQALTQCLSEAASVLSGTGVRLGLEPLNTRIDHPGYFLDQTSEALDIVDDVGRPEIGIVYDLYHAAVMGERVEPALQGRLSRVFHLHVADHPGRGDPGSGGVDLAHRLRWIYGQGYDGRTGLEYRPQAGAAATIGAATARLAASQR